MAMLLLVATRETSGFAVVLTVGAMKDVTPDDCPHAARAENAAPAAIERSRRDAATERKVNRAGLSSMSLPVCAENSHRGLGLRAAEFIIASPERSALALTTGHNSAACRHNLCSGIINGFFRYANLSPFANVSMHRSVAASLHRCIAASPTNSICRSSSISREKLRAKITGSSRRLCFVRRGRGQTLILSAMCDNVRSGNGVTVTLELNRQSWIRDPGVMNVRRKDS
jgi:hypothetical protein